MRSAWLLPFLLLCGCVSLGPPPVAQKTVRARDEDTLLDLARENGLGYGEIVAANPGVDPWLPGNGSLIVLPSVHLPPPAPGEGIVINIAEQRLYLFEASDRIVSYPIGIGRPGWRTPIGTTRVVKMREAPVWYPTASARREDPTLGTEVPAGPENPLGTHAIYLGWPRYLIHGTSEPYGVGRRVSRGCIRLYPEDIVRLYERIDVGTRVRVMNTPIKTGWIDSELYLEAHPTLVQESEHTPRAAEPLSRALAAELRGIAGESAERIDWGVVEQALRERRGVPLRITQRPRTPTVGERLRSLTGPFAGPRDSQTSARALAPGGVPGS